MKPSNQMSSYHDSKRSNKSNKTKNNNKQKDGKRMESEPHSYNIQAKLQSGILSIFVHDTMTDSKWRQEFTQISFPGHKLYNVAKSLIMAIQEMIDNTNYSTKGNNNNNDLDNDTEKKPIAILVYNQWCYLTIHGSNLPSFALRPIIKDQQTQNQQQKKNKNIQLKTIKPSIAPYGFTTNSQNNNIRFGDKNRDKRINKNITFKNKNISNNNDDINNHSQTNNKIKRRPKSKSTPMIVVNKGVVARNIARFSKQNENVSPSNTNNNKTPYSPNLNRKSNTNKHRHHKSKKSNKTNHKNNTNNNNNNNNNNCKPRKKLPSNPPPTLNSYQVEQQYESNSNSTLTTMQPMRPPTPSRKSIYFPGKPLPTLPIGSSSSYHNHYKQTTIHRNPSYSSQNEYYHNNKNNLSQPIQARYSASARNNIVFQPYIPAPPIPKKQMMAKKSQVTVTVIGHNYSQQPGQQPGQQQVSEPGSNQNDDRERQEILRPKYKKHDSIPVPQTSSMGNRSNSSSALSGVTNLSGISHLDVVGCSSSEYDDDEDDGIMINTDDDDDDSSSFKNIGHRSDDSRHGSIESNTGSLDSLFTNDGGDGIITGFMTEQEYNHRSNRSSNRSSNASSNRSSRHQQVDSAKLNLPPNKMKLYDSITTIDIDQHNDDILECEFSGNEDEYDIDDDLVDFQPRQSGPCGYLFEVSSNRTNQTNASLITHLTGRPTKRINNEWNDDHYDNDRLDIDDQTEGHTVNSSLYYHNTMSDEETPNHNNYNNMSNISNRSQSSKKKKKKGKKSKKKAKKRNSIKLTICLNGDIIDDMVGHVIDQQIAEEEYYEEEDAMSEPYYDPNYLGVNPYYSD